MGTTILVIDDSLTVRKVAERELTKAGYTVRTANTGAQGIQAVREAAPDLMLVDFMLPDMKGVDLCRSLAAEPNTRSTPIIVVSGKDAQKLEQELREIASVQCCVEKPFAVDSLLTKIRDALSRTGSRSRPPYAGPELATSPAASGWRPPAPPSREAPDSAAAPPSGPAREAVPARAPATVPAAGHTALDRSSEAQRVNAIVEEILRIFEKPADRDVRSMLLRLLVRKHLLSR